MSRSGRRGREQRLGDTRQQRAAVDVPDRDREAKAGGTSGEQPGRPLGEDVEGRRAVADRPGQGRAEAAFGIVLDEQPRRTIDDEGSAERERRRLGGDGTTEVVADECLQLDAAQPGAAVVADGDYFLPVPPLRVP